MPSDVPAGSPAGGEELLMLQPSDAGCRAAGRKIGLVPGSGMKMIGEDM